VRKTLWFDLCFLKRYLGDFEPTIIQWIDFGFHFQEYTLFLFLRSTIIVHCMSLNYSSDNVNFVVWYAGKCWIVYSMSHLIHDLNSLECLSSLMQLLGTASRCLKQIFAEYVMVLACYMGCIYLSLYSLTSGYNTVYLHLFWPVSILVGLQTACSYVTIRTSTFK
jgi:hypothetical protein